MHMWADLFYTIMSASEQYKSNEFKTNEAGKKQI